MTYSLGALSTLSLGTVQLGMPYGRVHASQPPAGDAVDAILGAAVSGGIACLDTARAYGAAEERIGAWLATAPARPVIISKLPAIQCTSADDIAKFVRTELETSLRALGVDRLDGYLVHRGDDVLMPGVENALREQRDRGRIGAYGVSVYEPDQLEAILSQGQPDVVELPLNVADRRFAQSGLIERCSERGIAVFARSAFLQGAFLANPAELPPFLAALRPWLDRFRKLCDEAGCLPASVCLNAVLRTPGVASVVVGVTRLSELEDNLAAWRSPPPPDMVDAALACCADIPGHLLDPRSWPA